MMQPAIALNGREKRYEWIHNEQSIALRVHEHWGGGTGGYDKRGCIDGKN